MSELPLETSSAQRVRRGVIGIIENDGLYLMIRRAPNIPKGGAWCFPGGHVEHGETSKRALPREFREELGIEIEPVQRLGSIRVMDTRHVLVAWRVRHVGGAITPAAEEVADWRWVAKGDIADVEPGLASNARVAQML